MNHYTRGVLTGWGPVLVVLIVAVVGTILSTLLGGCASQGEIKMPELPTVVHTVVEEYKPLPDWAKAQLPIAAPEDETLRARLKAGDANVHTIEYANCRSLLLDKLDKGESVDPKACDGRPGSPAPF